MSKKELVEYIIQPRNLYFLKASLTNYHYCVNIDISDVDHSSGNYRGLLGHRGEHHDIRTKKKQKQKFGKNSLS